MHIVFVFAAMLSTILQVPYFPEALMIRKLFRQMLVMQIVSSMTVTLRL